MKLANAEMMLERCQGCGGKCGECIHIGNVLDSLMAIRYADEISAQEDAWDADIDYLFSIAG